MSDTQTYKMFRRKGYNLHLSEFTKEITKDNIKLPLNFRLVPFLEAEKFLNLYV